MKHAAFAFGWFGLMVITTKTSSEETSTAHWACPQPALLYFPGSGRDILSNVDKLSLVEVRYDECRTTPDGLYTLPDGVVAEPVRESEARLFSEWIEDWRSYTSVASSSFTAELKQNLLGAPSSIVGTYAPDYLSAKKRLVGNDAAVARIYVRSVLYRLRLVPNVALHASAVARLNEVAYFFRTKSVEKARYLLETFVNDYGSHYSTRVDVGALLVEENDVSRVYLNATSDPKNLIAEAAGQLFLRMIRFRSDFPTDPTPYQAVMKDYQRYRLGSFVESIGGATLNENMTIDKWLDGARKNPAVVDRSGVPMLDVLREGSRPNLSRDGLATLRKELRNVLEKYYMYNTHSGCTDPRSKYFDFAVNVGDASCYGNASDYNFGGMYQQCRSTSDSEANPCVRFSLNTKNPLTNDYSCSPGFEETVLIGNDTFLQCVRRCNNTDCEEGCYRISAFWCVADPLLKREQLYFGGIYSGNLLNPLTGRRSCPPGYDALRLGSEAFVCAGKMTRASALYRIPFGGFFTPDVGNPFGGDGSAGGSYDFAFGCPVGYSEHLAIAESILNATSPLAVVKYCMRSGALNNSKFWMPLVSPPFISRDALDAAPLFGTTPAPPVSGLSANDIAAIVCGVLIACMLCAFVVLILYVRLKGCNPVRRRRQDEQREALLTSDPPATPEISE